MFTLYICKISNEFVPSDWMPTALSPAQGDFWSIAISEKLCFHAGLLLRDLPDLLLRDLPEPHLQCTSGAGPECEDFPWRLLPLLLLTPSFPVTFPPNPSWVRVSKLWSLSPSRSQTAVLSCGLCLWLPGVEGVARAAPGGSLLPPPLDFHADNTWVCSVQGSPLFTSGGWVRYWPMEASDRLTWFSYSFNSYLDFLYLEFSKFERAVLKPKCTGYLARVRIGLISGPDSWGRSSVPRWSPSGLPSWLLFMADPRENTAFLSCTFFFFQTWKRISLETYKSKIRKCGTFSLNP